MNTFEKPDRSGMLRPHVGEEVELGSSRDSVVVSLVLTRVPGGKGASLFYMIPLERWNVERSVTFCGKREVPSWRQPLLEHLIGQLELGELSRSTVSSGSVEHC